jgi:indole-3-glycerol phosphate synthase
MTTATNSDILTRILQRKREEVAERQTLVSLDQIKQQASIAPLPRGFFFAVSKTVTSGKSAIIAEIKKASPSKGIIREDFDPAWLASSYEQGGATCLSVLTDRDFFQGDDSFLIAARNVCRLPILRKDFMMDPYQIYESRAIGADCILLIVAALDDATLQELAWLAIELGMDVLVEVHNRVELERAQLLRTPMIGINNRDLHTFRTDLNTTIGLLTDVYPDRLVVTESGIHTRDDVALMRKYGVNAFLVGEAFMMADNPGEKLKELFE